MQERKPSIWELQAIAVKLRSPAEQAEWLECHDTFYSPNVPGLLAELSERAAMQGDALRFAQHQGDPSYLVCCDQWEDAIGDMLLSCPYQQVHVSTGYNGKVYETFCCEAVGGCCACLCGEG